MATTEDLQAYSLHPLLAAVLTSTHCKSRYGESWRAVRILRECLLVFWTFVSFRAEGIFSATAPLNRCDQYFFTAKPSYCRLQKKFANVMLLHLSVSHSLHGAGVCLWSREHRSRHRPSRQACPWAEPPPPRQIHILGQTPLRVDTPYAEPPSPPPHGH